MKSLETLTRLRHDLHQSPDLSNGEANTSKIIKKYLSSFKPDEIIENIGGAGLAFKFLMGDFKQGPTIGIRADLDALPIEEDTMLPYSSKNKGISHKCGHDGHMAMVAGIATQLEELKGLNGTIVLIFQPAEETGEGAKRYVSDSNFQKLKLDYVFGLHNLPGVEAGKVVLAKDVFSCSSVGMKVTIKGKTSHAAEPEFALHPIKVISHLESLLNAYNSFKEDNDFCISTLTHLSIGEKSFGICPGNAEIFLTLRAKRSQKLEALKTLLQRELDDLCANFKMKAVYEFQDYFPALENNNEIVELMQKLCEQKNFKHEMRSFPFRWSEDFGHFTQKVKGAFFGLGVGEGHLPLHDKDYDFNDSVIVTGVNFYRELIKHIFQLG